MDTMKTWTNGWNACYKSLMTDADTDLVLLGRAFGSGYNAGWARGVSYKPSPKYSYFSSSVVSDTVNSWIQRGYILYFGTQNATTKKIDVRGMKPI
jgi:hypothetical protein